MRHLIRIPASIYESAKEHFQAGLGERYGFFLAGFHKGASGTCLLVREFVPVDDIGRLTGDGFELPPSAWLPVRNRAHSEKAAVVEAHSHPFGPAFFSVTDEEWGHSFASYMLDDLPNRPYTAMVWAEGSVDARMWFPGTGDWTQVHDIDVLGLERRRVPTSGSERSGSHVDSESPARRYGRQLPAIGKAGQLALRAVRVGVVGLGGLGSMCALQLAYAGVRRFALVDRDRGDETSLNRLLGAGAADVGIPKPAIMEREIRRIAGSEPCEIQTFGELRTKEAITSLPDVDILIGAVDNDAARLIMNELAVAYLVPYFDLGVGIQAKNGVVTEAGGRVVFVHPEGSCLRCAKAYSPQIAAEELMDPADLERARAQGYVAGGDEPSPSVVTLNAVVSGLGMTEVIAFVTGLRAPVECVYYDMLAGSVALTKLHKNPKCVVCANAGRGPEIHLERYVKKLGPSEVETSGIAEVPA